MIKKLKFLIIHQNFPGQFRQLAPYLFKEKHEVVAICSHNRPLDCRFRIFRYQSPPSTTSELSYCAQHAHEAIQRASSVAHLCFQLKEEGWSPDFIFAHSGWGETLGIKEIWEETPLILWPEIWLLPEHAGRGVDPTKSKPDLDAYLGFIGRNTLTRAALSQSNAWILPTKYQAKTFPKEFQNKKMHIIHEGIDTDLASPNSSVRLEIGGIKITKETLIITFVSRNLERLRGFDTFMRSLPDIQRLNKDVRVLIVGGNGEGYGGGDPSGRILKEVLAEELKGVLDLKRIHFLGHIPHHLLLAVLQVSSVHVYLTYPFILGWSLIEAMACGCCIVASKGMPVSEVISQNCEGLLIDINSSKDLSKAIIYLLNNSSERDRLSRAARDKSLLFSQSIMIKKLFQCFSSIGQ